MLKLEREDGYCFLIGLYVIMFWKIKFVYAFFRTRGQNKKRKDIRSGKKPLRIFYFRSFHNPFDWFVVWFPFALIHRQFVSRWFESKFLSIVNCFIFLKVWGLPSFSISVLSSVHLKRPQRRYNKSTGVVTSLSFYISLVSFLTTEANLIPSTYHSSESARRYIQDNTKVLGCLQSLSV